MRARLLRVGLALMLAAHLAALYWPRIDTSGSPEGSDKLAHILLFAAPAAAAMLALRRPVPLVLALVVHAPLSEWLQSAWLPDRRGDLDDALADLAGVALGVLVALPLRRGWARARW